MFNGSIRDNDLFQFKHGAKAKTLFETLKPRLRDILEDSEYESLTLKKLPRLLEEIFYGFSARLDTKFLIAFPIVEKILIFAYL